MRANPTAASRVGLSAVARRIAFAVLLAALALVGRGVAIVPHTHAMPFKIWVLNMNVADSQAAAAGCTVPFACDLSTAADRAALALDFDTIQTESGGQVGAQQNPALSTFAGKVIILVETDGSLTNIQMNGRGLLCVPACDAVAGATPDPTDHVAVFAVTDAGTRARGDMFVVTPIQDSVSIDSRVITVVGQARDIALSTAKSTILQGAASCALTDSTTAATRSAATAVYTDIDGTPLVGYSTDWTSSVPGTMTVAAAQTTSRVLADGTTIAAPNVLCGGAVGASDVSATNSIANAIVGVAFVTRHTTITVVSVLTAMTLTASPAAIPCDGVASSTVTAKVTDSNGNNVADGTNVNFDVVAPNTANPVSAPTVNGEASSQITPFSGATSGVTVLVTAGTAQASIHIDCGSPGASDYSWAPMIIPQLPYDSSLNTAGFTTDVGESLPCGNMAATAWYRLDLPLGGADLTVDTAGSSFDTALAVYTGSPATSPPGGLSLLGCDANGTASSVRFIVSAPGTFLIQAGGQAGATGSLSLHVRCTNDLDCDGLTDADEALAGTNPGVADTDGDGLSDGLEVHTYHTNPLLADTDADACGDGMELHFVPPLDPLDPWDFYSVPAPALFAAPNPLTDVRDHVVGAADAQAIFAYFKKAAKTGSPEYEQDLDGDGVKDGIEYDRSVLGPAQSGPPDGIIGATDAQLAFAQFKKGYHC